MAIYIKLNPLKGGVGVSGHTPIISTYRKPPSLQFATWNFNKYGTLQKRKLYTDTKRSIEKESITWSWALPFSSGRGVNSIGLPWDLNCEELCDLFCLAFLTDFRENPSTLSTDGGVVGAEDISLLKRKKYHQHIPEEEAYKWVTQILKFPYTIFENGNMFKRKQIKSIKSSHMFNGKTEKLGGK